MRAWQVQKHGEPGDALALVDVPLPEPGPGELRVRVQAAALGLPDVFMCRATYAFRPELPFTPGQEVVGIVTAVGEGAETHVGARVMAVTVFFRGFGGLAEHCLVLDGSAHPVPDEMTDAEAAGFAIPYHTAYLGLVTRARLMAGEVLLVLGASGGTGSAAIQLGSALGARVIAVAGGAEKCGVCRELGADVVIDHTAHHKAQAKGGFASAVKEATDGVGANVIYDPVGGAAFDEALACIASEGRLLAVGFASGSWSDASTQLLVGRNASVLGYTVGAYKKPYLSQVQDELIAHWRAGAIRSWVGREVRLEDAATALAELAERRAIGKTVVRIDEGGAR